MFLVYVVLCLFLVVSTSAIDCLERLVSEMTYYVSNGTLNPTHSFTHYLCNQYVLANEQATISTDARDIAASSTTLWTAT